MEKIEKYLMAERKGLIPSGVIEYHGIQQFQSKERGIMNPGLIEDGKSQKRYKIYRELPIFYDSEDDNIAEMNKGGIMPFEESVRAHCRYGCFLCPFATKTYYEDLKEKDPETYQRCNELMELGSEEGKRYYYYRKAKIM